MKNILSTLKTLAARAMSWRKRAAAPEETATTEEPARTLPEAPPTTHPPAEPLPADEAAANTETGEAKPGLMSRLLARLAFWRRARKTGEAAAPPPAKPDATPGDDEAPARPPLAKRILAIFLKKSVWMPAAAILLVTASTVASIAFMRAQQAERDKTLHSLQAAKLQLEQENRQLRTQQTIIPAPPAAPNDASVQPSPPDPAFDIASQPKPSSGSTGGANGGGDCVVSDKANTGESLKRCIEAFNRAAGGQKRTRQ